MTCLPKGQGGIQAFLSLLGNEILYGLKVVSDSPELVGFSFGLLNSVDNLPDRQVKFLGNFKLQASVVQTLDSTIHRIA